MKQPDLGPCDEWDGAISDQGYGHLRPDGRTPFYAHRLSWMQDNGPTDLWILHRCDNRRCISPQHLYAGTPQQNSDDMKARNRQRKKTATACGKGHLWDEANTYWTPRGDRSCRTCHRANEAKRREQRRNREAA